MEVQSPGPTNNIVQQSTGTSCTIPNSSTEVSSTSSISNITAPINLENLDKECSALAGLFQQTVNDMKVGHNHLLLIELINQTYPLFKRILVLFLNV